MQIYPLKWLLPSAKDLASIVAPPYDVLSHNELACYEASPLNMVHLTQPEGNNDPMAFDGALKKAQRALCLWLQQGVWQKQREKAFFLYRLDADNHTQTGVVCGVAAQDVLNSTICVHEKTRMDKEDERARHMEVLGLHAEPVYFTYPGESLSMAKLAESTPLLDVTLAGVRHRLYGVRDGEALRRQFADYSHVYVADGHHRTAAAVRVALNHPDNDEAQYFPAVIFPECEMATYAYNRVVSNLSQQEIDTFLDRLVNAGFTPSVTEEETDPPAGFVDIWCHQQWHRIELPKSQAYDVEVLQERVLAPILGVVNPRTDARIRFVGGRESKQRLVRESDPATTIAFAVSPISMQAIRKTADAGGVLPPKSTWFEPKLLSGLFMHCFSEDSANKL